MALKTVLLLLSIVLAVRATDFDESDPLHQKLNGDLNSVCNELLGVPCKNSPPPPSSPNAPQPSGVPPALPPPIAPGPGPLGDGVATGVIQISLPDGVVLTPAQRTALYALLQAQISGNGVITPSAVGRKLLATDRLTFTVVGVNSCTDLLNTLNTYVESGEFASDANEESIPVQVATLLNALCAGRNAGVASVTNLAPPTPAPAPAPIVG